MATWINTADQLPPFGKYVLARHNRGTWRDSDDQANVNCVVVKRIRDINHGCNPNNRTDYIWKQFGPDSFFGQDITYWMEIPALEGVAEQRCCEGGPQWGHSWDCRRLP